MQRLAVYPDLNVGVEVLDPLGLRASIGAPGRHDEWSPSDGDRGGRASARRQPIPVKPHSNRQPTPRRSRQADVVVACASRASRSRRQPAHIPPRLPALPVRAPPRPAAERGARVTARVRGDDRGAAGEHRGRRPRSPLRWTARASPCPRPPRRHPPRSPMGRSMPARRRSHERPGGRAAHPGATGRGSDRSAHSGERERGTDERQTQARTRNEARARHRARSPLPADRLRTTAPPPPNPHRAWSLRARARALSPRANPIAKRQTPAPHRCPRRPTARRHHRRIAVREDPSPPPRRAATERGAPSSGAPRVRGVTRIAERLGVGRPRAGAPPRAAEPQSGATRPTTPIRRRCDPRRAPPPPSTAETGPDAASARRTSARGASRATTYRVRAGDSLWLIAERQLGPAADVGAIAREVTRLWERNRRASGPAIRT